jgi:hypothetical protein
MNFKKIIAAIVFSVAAVAAMASPSPKQIEKVLAAGDMQSARSMVSQVLEDHPNSARAHLLNAYILLNADKNKAAANEELKQVVRLDKTGDVSSSALFGKVVAQIERSPSAPVKRYVDTKPVAYEQPVKTSYAQNSYPQQSSSGIGFIGWILIIGGIGSVAYFIFIYRSTRPEAVEVYRPIAYTSNRRIVKDEPESRAYVQPVQREHVEYVAPQPVYQHTPVVHQAPQQQQGMGALGTAASVAGGVVAGNMLSDALRHNHSHGSHRTYDDYSTSRSTPTERYVEPEPAIDYRVKDASFSSSSSRDDDSWTSSRSSSSSSRDDSWTSSSSSSDYSSSSSSDYSSSSGSDW